MQLHTGVDHFGNVMIRGIILNVAAANEAVVKRAHYISKMSQNYSSYMQGKYSKTDGHHCLPTESRRKKQRGLTKIYGLQCKL
jgi:hypothetical protein